MALKPIFVYSVGDNPQLLPKPEDKLRPNSICLGIGTMLFPPSGQPLLARELR
jgi:hypothetical protein